MNLKIYYRTTLYLLLNIVQLTYSETINVPKSKIDQIRLDFKKISQTILTLGQSKIPNPFSKDIETISPLLNSAQLTDTNLKMVIAKLKKIKAALTELDPTTKVIIQIAPGKTVEKSLQNFLIINYRKFSSDLLLILESTQKIIDPIDSSRTKILKESFKPIFWGFYELFEHPYYNYLDTVRRTLHLDLNKEKLLLIRDIMELLLLDLNDENQNQTMMLETSASQKFNLTIRDFKELIKKYITSLTTVIK